MSTLYRLKAYFGMVPPEDMDAYADAYGYDPRDSDYDQYDRYGAYDRAETERPAHRGSSRPAEEWAADHAEQVPDQRQVRDGAAARTRHEHRTLAEPVRAGASGSGRAGHRTPSVHGALAVEPDPLPSSMLEPLTSVSGPSGSSGSTAAMGSMSRITTIHPRSYNEARTIGERYREGIPVIINLTELDDAAAKRLVDFAAGLAFALRGSIDKVTSRVFLLSPAGVDVSAEERRKLAERGFFGRD